MNEFYNMTIKEFFEFLEERQKEIKVYSDFYKENIVLYEKICRYDSKSNVFVCNGFKLKDMLNSKVGKQNFERILTTTYGVNFFDDNIKIDDKFSYEDLKKLYSLVAPLFIKTPTNFDEFLSSIEKMISLIEMKETSKANVERLKVVMGNIQRYISSAYKNIYENDFRYKITLELLDKVLSEYKTSKKEIKLSEEEIRVLINYLNKIVIYEEIDDNNEISPKEIEFGEITNYFINIYNDYIKENKIRKVLQPSVNKIYKNILKTNFDDLKKEDFPAYNEENICLIYKMLDDKFNKDINKYNKLNKLMNKKGDITLDNLYDLKAITQMMYAGFFTSKYYDKDSNKSISI